MIYSYEIFKEFDIIDCCEHCKLYRNHSSLSLRLPNVSVLRIYTTLYKVFCFFFLNIFRIAPGPPNVTDVGCGYYTMINLYIQCRSRDLYKL